jgi:hypothetical protein
LIIAGKAISFQLIAVWACGKQAQRAILACFLGERIGERSKRFWRKFENDSSTKKYGEF